MSDANGNAKHPSLTVAEFVARAPAALELKVFEGGGAAADILISSDRIQKLGLGLTGFVKYLREGRVKIVGQSEISFLSELSTAERKSAVNGLIPETIPCLLLTNELPPPLELSEFCRENRLPLLHTPLPSSKAIASVTRFLQEELAPRKTIHGVLLEMYGIGVLLLGRSGIGKSECALDLLSRGHRLIADDSVQIKNVAGRLEGESPELTREHLEIRGLGIINVRDIFGVSAVGARIGVHLCIQLNKWNAAEEIERLGLEMDRKELFGIEIPKFVLPVSSGRNIATLVETAVRVYLLRADGINAVEKLIAKHSEMVADRKQ